MLNAESIKKMKSEYERILTQTLEQTKNMLIDELDASAKKITRYLNDIDDRLFEIACSCLEPLKQSLLQRLSESFDSEFKFDLAKIKGPEIPETYNRLIIDLSGVALIVKELTLASLRSFKNDEMEFVQSKRFLYRKKEFINLLGGFEVHAQKKLKETILQLVQKQASNAAI